jgi:hypothetical protein
MDQCSRFQRLAESLVPETGASHPGKLGINERDKTVEGGVSATRSVN